MERFSSVIWNVSVKHPILKVNREPIRFYDEFMKNQLKLIVSKKVADQSHENETLKKIKFLLLKIFPLGFGH